MFPTAPSETTVLFRIDVPNHPDAIAISQYGSVLDYRPTEHPFREVEWATIDEPSAQGLVQSQKAIDAMNIEAWHEQGYFGQGVKIAVFDVEWHGAEWDNIEIEGAISHDCFAHRSCELPIDSSHPRFGFERGVHGIACAEVIKDIAPEAEIHLVRVLGQTSLENAIDWAIREDIDFISMSLSFFNESFYDGSGPINDLMTSLSRNDVQMVTSAGNYAQIHHRDFFQDLDGDRNHDFFDTRGLPIYFESGKKTINIIWDEFDTCGLGDLNAYLWNRDGTLIGKSLSDQQLGANDCQPKEKIVAMIENDDWTFLTIENQGHTMPQFDVMAKGGFVYQPHREGSIVDPGMHPSVLTIGAVRATNYLFNDVEGFSSYGSNSTIIKPEVVGPNGLSTQSYGPSAFYGTSASTPAVTAALAVYKSKNTSLSNQSVTEQIIDLAVSNSSTVQISESEGYGKVRLPNPENQNIQCGGSGMLVLCLYFRHLFKRTTNF